MSLTPGHELEEALQAVISSEYIERLDIVREDPDMSRAFITHVARFYPQMFTRLVDEMPGYVPWKEIVQLWEDGARIKAIKRVREKTGYGLREAKALIEAKLH